MYRELELQSLEAEVPLTLTDEDAGMFTLTDEPPLEPFHLGPEGVHLRHGWRSSVLLLLEEML